MKLKAMILLITLNVLIFSNVYSTQNAHVTTDYSGRIGALVQAPNDTIDPAKTDTTDIDFKNKKIRITENEEGTSIEVKKKEDEDEWENFDEDKEFDFDFEEDESFDLHWAGFEIGMNNYLNNDFSMNLSDENSFMELNTGKSWNVNINFIEYDTRLIGEKFGVGTGMGIEFNDYRFDNRQPIKKDNNQIIPDTSYRQFSPDKAKLTTTYITVPVIFEYQTPAGSDTKFYIAAGIIGGLKLGSHTKVVYDENGDKNKDKNRSDFYLAPFRYGYTVRMGYGFVKVFANYYETALFQKDKGPQLHPFTIGFHISF